MSGVYISYPFCAQKCTYCNFASGVFPREIEVRYRAALAREICAHTWDWTPDTVSLGGAHRAISRPRTCALCSTPSPDDPGRRPLSKPLRVASRPMPPAYNSGPVYRERIEREFSIPFEQQPAMKALKLQGKKGAGISQPELVG